MRSRIHVKEPPLKPLLIYDGECNFCKYWMMRWKNMTGEAVDYAPLQDPMLKARFPDIPQSELETAIHFIDTDGVVYYGAEAVFRTRAASPRHRLLLKLYLSLRPLSYGADLLYRIVSYHRAFFSRLWGTQNNH